MSLSGSLAHSSSRATSLSKPKPGRRALRVAAMAWVASASIGQLNFVAYIASFYGRSTLPGARRPERWNDVMSRSFVQGDHPLKWVLGVHLLMALPIILGGLAQLVCPPCGATSLPFIGRTAGFTWSWRTHWLMVDCHWCGSGAARPEARPSIWAHASTRS